MPKYDIRAMYEYWAEGIEADTPEEAKKIFLNDLDSYYWGTYSLEIVEDKEDE